MGFQVSKLKGTCTTCKRPVSIGQRIWWTVESRGLEHAECHGPEPEPKVFMKPKRLHHSQRCPQKRELFGEVLRCERERIFDEAPYHQAGHSYHFTVRMTRRLFARIAREKESKQLSLADLLEPNRAKK